MRENIEHPTQREVSASWTMLPAYVMSNNAPCEGGKHTVTELLLSSFVYRSWRLGTTQKALLFESVFFVSSWQTIHIFGVKENEKVDEWGACGGMCQYELMINLAAWVILNTSRQSAAICSEHLGVVCGKETGLSVGNGFLLIRS